MKIVTMERLIDEGEFSSTPTWKHIEHDILEAIATIEWPKGSGKFILYPQSGKKRGQGNGVVPIKKACMIHLESRGWLLERPLTALGTGKVDAVYPTEKGFFCVEWETGNISSSHRAINKMAMGLTEGMLIGGVLIVPTKEMARYLTDRIGNFPELQPYFSYWRKQKVNVKEGLLEIIAVEHDATSYDVPRIEKGTSGRALA